MYVFVAAVLFLSCDRLFVTPLTSLPGSSVHGIFQARIWEWVAIYFSRGSSHRRDQNTTLAGGYVYWWATGRAHIYIYISSVQSLSCVWLFAAPRIAACQASLSVTNSWSLLKLMSIELVMPSNRLILCCPLLLLPLLFPASGSYKIKSLCCTPGTNIIL